MVISAKTARMVRRIKKVTEKNVVNISQRREKGEGDGGMVEFLNGRWRTSSLTKR